MSQTDAIGELVLDARCASTYEDVRALRLAYENGAIPNLQPSTYHHLVSTALATIGGFELEDLLMTYDPFTYEGYAWAEEPLLRLESWKFDLMELTATITKLKDAYTGTEHQVAALAKKLYGIALANRTRYILEPTDALSLQLNIARQRLAVLKRAYRDAVAWRDAFLDADELTFMVLGPEMVNRGLHSVFVEVYAFRGSDGNLRIPAAVQQSRLYQVETKEFQAISAHTSLVYRSLVSQIDFDLDQYIDSVRPYIPKE